MCCGSDYFNKLDKEYNARYLSKVSLIDSRDPLVSRGQIAISAQGVYRLQYKLPRRKGSGRFPCSADLVSHFQTCRYINFLIALCA